MKMNEQDREDLTNEYLREMYRQDTRVCLRGVRYNTFRRLIRFDKAIDYDIHTRGVIYTQYMKDHGPEIPRSIKRGIVENLDVEGFKNLYPAFEDLYGAEKAEKAIENAKAGIIKEYIHMLKYFID